MVILETQAVSKCFRVGARTEVRALDSVSLVIPRGSFCVLNGPSGSGKTSMLALLGALQRPTQGQVLFEGRDLATLSDAELARVRRRMGFVFQNFSLIRRLPVWENITYPLIPRGVPRSERYACARSILDRLHLAQRLSADPEELSGGEQQRVAVARALASQPDVLLADEPTSNLDPSNAESLASLLRDIHATGTTVIVSTHDPYLMSMATEVFLLESGRLSVAA